jgi:LPS sulfotransferase NodH
MVPFVIVADLRTGSTLLSTSLDNHPQVRCYGELFHPETFPDNSLDRHDRFTLNGRDVVERAFAAPDVEAAGFRAMIFLPLSSQPLWADAWNALRDRGGLRVIYLTRRDELAQYASILIADQIRVWHPSPDDPVLRPENRPRITIDPQDFRDWSSQRARLLDERREQLQGKPSLDLEYETLVSGWSAVIHQVQEFLGVDPMALEAAKQKQEKRPLPQVIENYDDLRSLCPTC